MACLGVEPRVAGLKAQANPLSYGGVPAFIMFLLYLTIAKTNHHLAVIIH